MPRRPEVRERVSSSICAEGDSDAYNLRIRLKKNADAYNLSKRPKKADRMKVPSLSGIQDALNSLEKQGYLNHTTTRAQRGDREKKIYRPTKRGLRDYVSSPNFTWDDDICKNLSHIAQLHGHILPKTLGQWSWIMEQQIDDVAVKVIEKWNLGRREEDPEEQFYGIAETGEITRIITTQEGPEMIVEKVLTDEERQRWKQALQRDPELAARFPSTRKTYEPLTGEEKTRWLQVVP